MDQQSPLVSSIQAIVVEVVISDLQVKPSHLASLRNVKDSFPAENHNHSLGPMLYLLLDKIRQLQEEGRIISLSLAKTLSQLGLAMGGPPMKNDAPAPTAAHFTPAPRYSNQSTPVQNFAPPQPQVRVPAPAPKPPVPRPTQPPLSAPIPAPTVHRPTPPVPRVAPMQPIRLTPTAPPAPTYQIPTPSVPREPLRSTTVVPRPMIVKFEPFDDCITVSSDEEEEEKEEERKDEEEEEDSCPRLETSHDDSDPPVIEDDPHTTSTSSNAARHLVAPTTRLAETACPFCNKQWPSGVTPSVLSKHLSNEHADVPGTFFRCTACPGLYYRSYTNIKKHHDSLQCAGSIVFDHVDHGTSSSKPKSSMPTSCAFCDKSWPNPPQPKQISRHLHEAHDDVLGTFFRCSLCPMRSRKSRYVVTHLTNTSCGGCIVFDHATEQPKKIMTRKRRVVHHSDDDDDFTVTTKSPRIDSAVSYPYRRASGRAPRVNTWKANDMPLDMYDLISCPWCGEEFPNGISVGKFYLHFKAAHNDMTGTIFTCSACPSIKTRSSGGIATHFASLECGGRAMISHDPNHVVKRCNREELFMQVAAAHANRSIYGGDTPSINTAEEEMVNAEPPKAPGRECLILSADTKCPVCDDDFGKAKAYELYEHFREYHYHVPGSIFACSSCPSFKKRTDQSMFRHFTNEECNGRIVVCLDEYRPQNKEADQQETAQHKEAAASISSAAAEDNQDRKDFVSLSQSSIVDETTLPTLINGTVPFVNSTIGL